MPTAEDFRALARSSPWRWQTARFTVRWSGAGAQSPVRAWLRRPDALRVETLTGELVQAGRESAKRVGVYTTDGGREVTLEWMSEAGKPELRADGLVARRPDDHSFDADAPFFQNYHWVAMLDPLELADGAEHEWYYDVEGRLTGTSADPAGEPVGAEVRELTEVEIAGRPAWQATLVPTAQYEPRCSCCPLLPSAVADELEGQPVGDYADAHLVALDVGTGICVMTAELGGPRPGAGHTLAVEAVDEPMDDALFPLPRRWWQRRGQ